jgi:hypothetical protein
MPREIGIVLVFALAVIIGQAFGSGPAAPQGKEFVILEAATIRAELEGKTVALSLPVGARVTVWAREEKEGKTLCQK